MFGFFENKATELWKVVAPEKTDGERLFICVEEGRVAEVENYLVQRAMDPNLKNKAGNTLLHVAAYHGQETVVKLLLQHGADVRALGSRMNSCLHYAASKGHMQLVKFFVEEAGLSAGQKNSLGKTAYDVAEAFSVKQYLMKLVLAEEAQNGTGPTMLGISRDRAEDEKRLQNLPPPPTMGAVAADMNPQLAATNRPDTPPTAPGMPPTRLDADPNYRPSPSVSRPIREDGFTTTVGNPELSAKYGNHTTFRPSPSSYDAPSTTAGPPQYTTARSGSPFATRGRYVTYDAKNNTAGKAVVPKGPVAAPPSRQANVNVFTPAPQQQQSQQQQPHSTFQPQQQQPQLHQSQRPQQLQPKGFGEPRAGSPMRPPNMQQRSPEKQ